MPFATKPTKPDTVLFGRTWRQCPVCRLPSCKPLGPVGDPVLFESACVACVTILTRRQQVAKEAVARGIKVRAQMRAKVQQRRNLEAMMDAEDGIDNEPYDNIVARMLA